MRATSSRSSVIRTSCTICRSMVARAFSIELVVAAGEANHFDRRANRRERVAQFV
jgi:hypothetical protein